MLRKMAREKAAKDYAFCRACSITASGWPATARRWRDAYFIGIARWGEDLGLFDIAKEFPGIHRHMAKLEADPAVIFAHAIEDEAPATSSGGFLGHSTLQDLDVRLAA